MDKQQHNTTKFSNTIKAGVDKDGKPYIDLSDRPTAAHFMAQADRFKNIKCGEPCSPGCQGKCRCLRRDTIQGGIDVLHSNR